MTDVYNARFLLSGVGFLKVTVRAESVTFLNILLLLLLLLSAIVRVGFPSLTRPVDWHQVWFLLPTDGGGIVLVCGLLGTTAATTPPYNFQMLKIVVED